MTGAIAVTGVPVVDYEHRPGRCLPHHRLAAIERRDCAAVDRERDLRVLDRRHTTGPPYLTSSAQNSGIFDSFSEAEATLWVNGILR